jgi:hypothetical protein
MRFNLSGQIFRSVVKSPPLAATTWGTGWTGHITSCMNLTYHTAHVMLWRSVVFLWGYVWSVEHGLMQCLAKLHVCWCSHERLSPHWLMGNKFWFLAGMQNELSDPLFLSMHTRSPHRRGASGEKLAPVSIFKITTRACTFNSKSWWACNTQLMQIIYRLPLSLSDQKWNLLLVQLLQRNELLGTIMIRRRKL